MIGIRAFGQNEGALGHTGDFKRLFAPLLPELSEMAVYGMSPSAGLSFPFDMSEKELMKTRKWLDELDMTPERSGYVEWPCYYRAGFFPKFTQFIRDDWNTLVCFHAPFPPYGNLLQAHYGKDSLDYDAIKRRAAEVQRRAWLQTSFRFYFRNIDACWWEVFSPDTDALQQLSGHLSQSGIAFQELLFEEDFPDPSTPLNREFKGVHHIWSPKEGQTAAPNGGPASG